VCISLILTDLALWICAQEQRTVRSLKTNKKRRRMVNVSPHWGEPCISCVDVLCAMLLMLFMWLFDQCC
jgi:hypothetical protein